MSVPIKSNNSKTAGKSLFHLWIIKLGPLIYLVTDRGSDYINTDMAQLSTLMGIRHSPRTPHSPWANGLVEVQNKNIGTHLRIFLQKTPKDWDRQVHMYAYAPNSQHLFINVSPRETVFHTCPRIPLTFDLNLNRDSKRTCISKRCSGLPEHSHYDNTDLNPFFYRTRSKHSPSMVSCSRNCYFTKLFYGKLFKKLTLKLILQKHTIKINLFILELSW